MESSGAQRIDAVVIGAGVVGLAVARALALAGREVLVLEAERSIGTGTSARNSGVIHAGIYYPRDSLKAKFCVAGREALYRYCEERNIAHRRLGKLIVATRPNEVGALRRIRDGARANGVDDLGWLSGADVTAIEPEIACHAALMSPSTGIIDVHELMLAYQGDLENHGGTVAFGASVRRGRVTGQGILLEVEADGAIDLLCNTVVNCAGLGAQAVAAGIEGLAPAAVPTRYLAKGNYFRFVQKAPFRHLVYPLPKDSGLGVHLTLDLGGQARFGPDVQWIETIDYSVDETRLAAFETAIRDYWPGLPSGAIEPDYCGIRSKLHPPGTGFADFIVQDAGPHGAPGLINLFGIESPGLTSSLAIGDHVAEMCAAAERTAAPKSRRLSA